MWADATALLLVAGVLAFTSRRDTSMRVWDRPSGRKQLEFSFQAAMTSATVIGGGELAVRIGAWPLLPDDIWARLLISLAIIHAVAAVWSAPSLDMVQYAGNVAVLTVTLPAAAAWVQCAHDDCSVVGAFFISFMVGVFPTTLPLLPVLGVWWFFQTRRERAA